MKFRIVVIIILFFFVEIFPQKNLISKISTPQSAKTLETVGNWQTSGKSSSVFVSNNIAYVGNDNKIDIVDITFPNSPELKGQIILNTSFNCEDIVGNNEFIYVANNQTIYAINVSDPSNPDSVASIKLNSLITDIYIFQNKLYAIASYDFYILEIINENTINMAGKLSLPESSLGLTRFDIEGDLAFIASWEGGIYIVDISDSSDPKLHGRFLENSNLVFANNLSAYTASLMKMYVLDITDSVLPAIISEMQIPGIAYDIYADENYIYILIDDKLEIYNIEFEIVLSYTFQDIGQRLFFANGFIYIANNLKGLQILKFFGPDSKRNENNLVFDFSLEQNYPNPFNSQTRINYSIGKNCQVEINIYDMLGNKVEKLLNQYKTAGSYEIEFNSNNLSSGIYYYVLKTSTGFTNSKKLVILK